MTKTLAEPRQHRRALPHPSHDMPADPVTKRVLWALFQKATQPRGRERRNEQRYPYPHPIYLTPLTSEGPQVEETVQVFGKHLSEHGLDFYTREPLAHRRMIVSLPVEGGWMGLILDLKWCRFTSDSVYDNGGRFIGSAPSPLAESPFPAKAAAG